MSQLDERIDNFAKEIFESAGGAFITANQVRRYLGCGRSTAEQILKPLVPVYNATYKKYYYRDVARLLATGGQ